MQKLCHGIDKNLHRQIERERVNVFRSDEGKRTSGGKSSSGFVKATPTTSARYPPLQPSDVFDVIHRERSRLEIEGAPSQIVELLRHQMLLVRRGESIRRKIWETRAKVEIAGLLQNESGSDSIPVYLVRLEAVMSMSVAVEVDENEESETVALLRRHEREKIRANKLLKSLRFKLDSARGGGVDSGSGAVSSAAANKVVYDFSDDSDSEIIDHSLHVVTINDYSSSPSDQSHSDVGNKADHHGVDDDEEANYYCSENVEKSQVNEAPQSMGRSVSEEPTNYPPPKAAQNEGVEAVMMRSNIGEDENNSRNREMVVRMMRLLWERNKAQTRVLNELTYRVDHMEKACSKLYRFFTFLIFILIVFYFWG